MRRVRVLGVWWGPPKGDFPVYGLASRIKQLRDAETVKFDDQEVVSIYLGEDDVSYGHAVFYISKNESAMIMLEETEDWEAIRHAAEERAGSKEDSTRILMGILRKIAERGCGCIDADEL